MLIITIALLSCTTYIVYMRIFLGSLRGWITRNGKRNDNDFFAIFTRSERCGILKTSVHCFSQLRRGKIRFEQWAIIYVYRLQRFWTFLAKCILRDKERIKNGIQNKIFKIHFLFFEAFHARLVSKFAKSDNMSLIYFAKIEYCIVKHKIWCWFWYRGIKMFTQKSYRPKTVIKAKTQFFHHFSADNFFRIKFMQIFQRILI